MIKTIVFIDDELDLLFIYKAVLEDSYNVVCLNNPLEVLPYLKANKVDLLVSDINMPELSGRVLVADVKREFPELKVVGISACYFNKESDFMFDAYLQKPLNGFKDLLSTIERLS